MDNSRYKQMQENNEDDDEEANEEPAPSVPN